MIFVSHFANYNFAHKYAFARRNEFRLFVKLDRDYCSVCDEKTMIIGVPEKKKTKQCIHRSHAQYI